MKLSVISLIAAIAIGIVRLHTIFDQIQLFSHSGLSQTERMFPLVTTFLLLPLPALLFFIATTNVRLRVSPSNRVLAIVTAMGLALLSTLPGAFQILRLVTRLSPVQTGWLVIGLFAQLTAIVFLLTLAANPEEEVRLGAPAPYETPSVRMSAIIAMAASGIAIAIHLMITALMFVNVVPGGTSSQALMSRAMGLVSVVSAFLMAMIVFLSDPSRMGESAKIGHA
jgi:hypothetical protein